MNMIGWTSGNPHVTSFTANVTIGTPGATITVTPSFGGNVTGVVDASGSLTLPFSTPAQNGCLTGTISVYQGAQLLVQDSSGCY